MTLVVVYVPGRHSILNRAVVPVSPLSTPLANSVPVSTVAANVGISMPSKLNHNGSVRPGCPSLMNTIAPAGDASASMNFWAKVQVPRCTMMIAPAGTPA